MKVKQVSILVCSLNRTILRIQFKEVWLESVDWTHHAQGKDQWQVPVSMVMNSAFHKRQEISCLADTY